MRWEEMSWDKVRRAQMRWSVECEECSVKCGAWRVQCEVWSVECEESNEKWEVWSVDCEVWSVKCGVWSVKCGLGRVQCEVRSVECEVWSAQCGVWRVQWEVWRAKWSFKCDMWNRAPLSQSARTHGLGWRTARASSIDEKGLIYNFRPASCGHYWYTYTTKYIFIIFHFLSAWRNWPGLRGIFRLPRLGASLSALAWPFGLVVECQQLSNLDEAGIFSQDFLGLLRWSFKS